MANSLFMSNWLYRGEGNKTLVISNPETRKVLRLQKSNVFSGDRENSTHETSRMESDNLRIEFVNSITLCKQLFAPMLGEKYVTPGEFVELPQEFMTKIKDLVTSANKERPSFRLGKEVRPESIFGILMPDFCFISGGGIYANEVHRPTFCVEIKPKCGTLPVCPELEDSAYKEVKESICKYCLLQWTKVHKEGKYSQRSEYCPLDLFSSDMMRVWHALTCLLKNPQNNLRIFHDGKTIYSGETEVALYDDNDRPTDDLPSSTGKKFPSHLLQLEDFLRHSFVGTKRADVFTGSDEIDGTNMPSTTIFQATLLQLLLDDSNDSTMVDNCCSTNHPVCAASQYDKSNDLASIPACLLSKQLAFGKGGVLRRILNMQKLDEVGSDKAFSLFNELCADGFKDALDAHIFTLNRNVIKCKTDVKVNTTFDGKSLNGCCTNAMPSMARNLDNITKCLMAASANDCSIMISFQEATGETSENSRCFQDALTGLVYEYSIAVVDVDQKESDRIPRYYREYHAIVDNYLHFNQI